MTAFVDQHPGPAQPPVYILVRSPSNLSTVVYHIVVAAFQRWQCPAGVDPYITTRPARQP